MPRIVCLTGETIDILDRLGMASSIVGVTAFTDHPAARTLPVVSGYTSFNYAAIEKLRPTLVLAYSALQADAVAELSRRGLNVLVTHQSTIATMFQTITLLGGVTGRTAEAATLVSQLQTQWDEAKNSAASRQHRPKVYFEEWRQPLVAGVTWISELIEAAGGEDIFSQAAKNPDVKSRVIAAEDVVQHNPGIILASWCGEPVDINAICSRPGWLNVAAVRNGHIYELPGEICLQPGPALITRGLPEFKRLIALA